MSRRNQAFRQGDVTKAVKGAAKAGREVQRVEIEPGKIVLVLVPPGQQSAAQSKNEWDEVR
jgi:hypothetical protein